MQPAAHPMWMATGFPIVCAGALVHAQGGEMQTFFPCSNPACDEGLETLKHEFGTACQQCAWCRGTGGDWRESAEDDDACL